MRPDGSMTSVIQSTGHDVLYAEDGSALARGAGMFRFALTFDASGNFASRRIVKEHVGLEYDLCAVLARAIG